MRIYLAGPELFLADAARIAAAKRAICAARAMSASSRPTRRPCRPRPTRAASGSASTSANEAHIRSCDALIANLTPFRGPSADPGTVYELGFMRALGRPVSGFMNTAGPLRQPDPGRPRPRRPPPAGRAGRMPRAWRSRNSTCTTT